jgi:maltose O-acetyltransferase
VIVCPGVTIGDNSVIGAGSVVVQDIPANVVAVGNPARVLREI